MQVVIVIFFVLIMRKGKNKIFWKVKEFCDIFDVISILYDDDDLLKFGRQYELQKICDYKKKESKLIVMVRDVVLYLLFMFFMVIVCYGNKSIYRFFMMNIMC